MANVTAAGQPPASSDPWKGYEPGPVAGEQVYANLLPFGVRLHINAPDPPAPRDPRPVRLVIYALPNGNTIEQTIGKRLAEGDDWHFDIQHIGAQIRRLREVATDTTWIVAYVEAEGRSWPKWVREHGESGPKPSEIIEAVRKAVPLENVTVDLASHSGGGALIFAYINEVEAIPDWIGRIVLLDSNYAYDDASTQADKLVAWLRRDASHHLGVIAYDDRKVEIDGKPIVSPTGGTYRRTTQMLERLRREVEFTTTTDGPVVTHRALAGQLELVLVENPDNKILHTVLVEKNGLIHGLTFGGPFADRPGRFWHDRAYERWIQP
jgi:hypothetical protein